jgi:hypothetical protein
MPFLSETLPSLCEYCGVSDSISADASVPERNDLLQRWCSLCRFDFDCLPCVLELQPEMREQLYEYIITNILRIVEWSVLDFETFRTDLMETIELSACWAKVAPHVWLDYAKETTTAFATELRELSSEEIVLVRQAAENL